MQGTGFQSKSKCFDIIYVEGPGDVVESFHRWNNHEDMISETSRTFSGQFFDFCKLNNLRAYVISYHEEAKQEVTAQFYVENLPKTILGGGVLYHLSQIIYGLRLIAVTLYYRPKYLSVTSGVTYWFLFAPLKLFGIKITPQLHNCFWPSGFPPTGLIKRMLLALDGWFFRRIATVTLCVSPEIQRQIEIISGNNHRPVYQFRAQFYRNDFKNPPQPLAHNQRPFNVVYSGRVERNKGVFDLLELAEQLRNDGVTFEICGSGSVLEELRQTCQQRGLNGIVTIHGKLQRPELLAIYAKAHAVIVPTRSDFCEGLPLVIAEAILLNRPIITTRLSNALDLLGKAIVEAQPDDIDSFVRVIRQLLSDSSYYDSLALNCGHLREQFLDGKQGLTSVLNSILIE